MNPQTGKRWWQSKTVWVNLLSLVAQFVAYLVANKAGLGISPQVWQAVLLVQTWVNLILRFASSQAIS